VVKAYMLIVTQPGETRRLVEAIRQLRLVREVHEVMGPYDIVAEIEAESLQEIPGILQEEIRSLPGIHSTTSLVAFPI
jgi:DNA-binding Lrp family transcriptional regulator